MPKDSKPPAFLFYPDDFSSDGKVEAMSTEEVGAYILLLCKSWRESPPGSIPNDDLVLARWARLTPDRWSVCRSSVLAAFTLGPDSRWHQSRLRREYDKLCSVRRERKKAAKLRWDKPLNANALQVESIPFSITSSQLLTSNKQEPFKPPEPSQVQIYMASLGIADCANEAQKFVDHFSNRGWRFGNGKGSVMRDWKASVRTWRSNLPKFAAPVTTKKAAEVSRETQVGYYDYNQYRIKK